MPVSVLGLSDHPGRVPWIHLTVGQEQGSLQRAPGNIFSLVSNTRWWLGGSLKPDV